MTVAMKPSGIISFVEASRGGGAAVREVQMYIYLCFSSPKGGTEGEAPTVGESAPQDYKKTSECNK